jgi:hypothetical protein
VTRPPLYEDFLLILGKHMSASLFTFLCNLGKIYKNALFYYFLPKCSRQDFLPVFFLEILENTFDLTIGNNDNSKIFGNNGMEFENNSDDSLPRRTRKRVPHYELTSRMQRFRNEKSIERIINDVQNYCSRIGLVIISLSIKTLRTEGIALNNDESIIIDDNNVIESENNSETSIGSIEASLNNSVNPIVRDNNY